MINLPTIDEIGKYVQPLLEYVDYAPSDPFVTYRDPREIFVSFLDEPVVCLCVEVIMDDPSLVKKLKQLSGLVIIHGKLEFYFRNCMIQQSQPKTKVMHLDADKVMEKVEAAAAATITENTTSDTVENTGTKLVQVGICAALFFLLAWAKTK